MPMNPEGQEPREQEKKEYPYDAIIVLGGGLQKVGEKYYPTDYRHSDDF